jgi:hypothetical protein
MQVILKTLLFLIDVIAIQAASYTALTAGPVARAARATRGWTGG